MPQQSTPSTTSWYCGLRLINGVLKPTLACPSTPIARETYHAPNHENPIVVCSSIAFATASLTTTSTGKRTLMIPVGEAALTQFNLCFYRFSCSKRVRFRSRDAHTDEVRTRNVSLLATCFTKPNSFKRTANKCACDSCHQQDSIDAHISYHQQKVIAVRKGSPVHFDAVRRAGNHVCQKIIPSSIT